MKKLFIVALFGLFVSCCCYGQDVKVNINNNDATAKEDCAYRINGICSSEDIGGVDVEFSKRDNGNHYNGQDNYDTYVVFKNYNGYTVTVICKIDYELGGDIVSKTVNTVLSKGGVKEIKINDFAWSRIWKETVSGMIVRKLAD